MNDPQRGRPTATHVSVPPRPTTPPPPPPAPRLADTLHTVDVSWHPEPSFGSQRLGEIHVSGLDGERLTFVPADPHRDALAAWAGLPWWRRWFTRRPPALDRADPQF